MNPSDIARIVTTGHAVAAELDRHGRQLLTATHDWQSPLRSGTSGPKGKGGHGDPTVTTMLSPDPLATEHEDLVADIKAWDRAGANLFARLKRLEPVDPLKVERGRVNQVAACIACSGPAPRCRRGLCDSCYTAWIRADRPDMHVFRLRRAAELSPPEREHVDPMLVRSHQGTAERTA